MKKLIQRFITEEEGQGVVEYGLIIGLIAVIVVAVFIALGPQIKRLFTGAVSEGHIEAMQDTMANAT